MGTVYPPHRNVVMISDVYQAHGSYSINISFAPLTLGETKQTKRGGDGKGGRENQGTDVDGKGGRQVPSQGL